MNEDELAKACADAMWRGDSASPYLGMELVEVKKSYAKLTMTVQKHMVNGHKMCHGGLIFTLADSAFAFACNTDNRIKVGQHCVISYLRPAYENDVLIAIGTEHNQQGRSSMTDVQVYNQKDEKIAEFRGFSRAVKGQIIDMEEV